MMGDWNGIILWQKQTLTQEHECWKAYLPQYSSLTKSVTYHENKTKNKNSHQDDYDHV